MKFLIIFTIAMLVSSIGFKKFVKSTPILLPFIPLYSVAKYKWLVG